MKLVDAQFLLNRATDGYEPSYRQEAIEELVVELTRRYLIPDLAHEEAAEEQAEELAELASNPNV